MENLKDKNRNNGEDKGNQKDARAEFVAKKLERMASALYLVTNHFPAGDPLRSSIRQKAVSLLSVSHAFQTARALEEGAHSYNLSTTLGELLSLLGVARNSGLISPQNIEVLRRECASLGEVTGVAKGALGEAVIESDFFHSKGALPLLSHHTKQRVRRSSSKARSSTRNRRSSGGGDSSQSPLRASKKRRENILAVLKKHGKVSIKDIAREVRGCSRKTIQRELKDLAEEDVVGMEGKRRWTRYFLR